MPAIQSITNLQQKHTVNSNSVFSLESSVTATIGTATALVAASSLSGSVHDQLEVSELSYHENLIFLAVYGRTNTLV